MLRDKEEYVGEIYYENKWLKIKRSEIIDEVRDLVKVEVHFPMSHPFSEMTLWINKSEMFYYDEIYTPTRKKIEMQFVKNERK